MLLSSLEDGSIFLIFRVSGDMEHGFYGKCPSIDLLDYDLAKKIHDAVYSTL